jgi:hypothetical protein
MKIPLKFSFEILSIPLRVLRSPVRIDYTSAKWVLSACLIVAMVTVMSNEFESGMMRASVVDLADDVLEVDWGADDDLMAAELAQEVELGEIGGAAGNAGDGIFEDEEYIPDSEFMAEGPEDVNLRVVLEGREERVAVGDEQEGASTMKFGSVVDVFRFKIYADYEYALRYITFRVDSEGLNLWKLQDADNWAVYLVENGEVDYSEEVGFGEIFNMGYVKMRFYLPENKYMAFEGERGETEFALVSNVIRDEWAATENGEPVNPYLKISIPGDNPDSWAWAVGRQSTSWMSVDEKFGSEYVKGL